MIGWQLIETAPKDGTPILGYRHRKGCVVVVHGTGGWQNWYTVPGRYPFNPTHWMPLPEPPK